ncbi:Metallo-peptidase family M12-domain-containing protein [Pilobolus umbonatus]|nr:Metallo-peptidase family M12-domain-containing protein [Pilobolus umbonatus]
MLKLYWVLCGLFPLIRGYSTEPYSLNRVENIENIQISFSRKRDLTETLLLEFTAFDQTLHLSLSPNQHLFHPDATVSILNVDGSIQSEERLSIEGHLIYQGHVNHDASQWARITFREDIKHSPPLFEGSFFANDDLYHIKTTQNFQLFKRHDDPIPSMTTPMIIYRDSDQSTGHLQKRSPSDIMCAMEEMAYNRRMAGSHTQSLNPFSSLWDKRDLDDPFSSRVLGCPTARKIAYMGAAADCSYVLAYGSTRYAKLQMINDWNVASAVYEKTFNVSLGLIYLQLSVPDCPSKPKQHMPWNQACSSHYTINQRLSDFSLWRGNKGDDGAALWHLMTKCSTGVKVGIAWLGQLCETRVSQQIEEDGSFEWVSGTGVSSITRDEWKVVAHEIGHGFGAIHDCTRQSCPCQNNKCSCCPLSDTVCSAGDTYLMNPTSNVTSNDFSPCSVSDICSTFPSIGYCLKSPDLRLDGTFSLCGNGILEPGEECDSGANDSPCCYAKTCRLKSNAKCDDYSHQCCLNCDIAPADTICRPAVSECDINEYCTGESNQCPPDIYDKDGTSCMNGTMKCASGICTSRDQQCMTRGLRQNIVEECSFQKDSCLISCTDPDETRNCLMLSGMFLDGTECGLAGFCEKGVCVGTGTLNTIKAWTEQNKSIAIPIYVFGSLGVILIIVWLVWMIRKEHKKKIILENKHKDSRPPSIISYVKSESEQRRFSAQVLPFPPNHDPNSTEWMNSIELNQLDPSSPPRQFTNAHRRNKSLI